MTAGPALPIPSPITTKMPVPITAPMPSAVRSREPTARLSPPSSAPDWVSLTRREWSLTANGPDNFPRASAMLCLPVPLALLHGHAFGVGPLRRSQSAGVVPTEFASRDPLPDEARFAPRYPKPSRLNLEL